LEDVKIKLVVLWILKELVDLVYMTIAAFEPGVIEQIMEGEIDGIKIGPELLLLISIIYLVPLVMAFLSLTLKDSTNRWANIIAGIAFAGLGLFDLIGALAAPSIYAYAVLMSIAGVVVAALIVWYAWKWPKKKD